MDIVGKSKGHQKYWNRMKNVYDFTYRPDTVEEIISEPKSK